MRAFNDTDELQRHIGRLARHVPFNDAAAVLLLAFNDAAAVRRS